MEEGKELTEQKSMTPGFGVAGLVVCPLMKSACMKSGCEWWVELTYDKHKVARCSMAWMTLLSTEVRQSIDKLKKNVDEEK